MKNKLIILILAVLIISSLGYFVRIQSQPKNTLNNTVATGENVENIYDWQIPQLPNEYAWETHTITADDEEAQEFQLYLRGLAEHNDSQYENVPLGGTVYLARVSDLDPNYEKFVEFANTGFYNELNTNGWQYRLNQADWEINSMAADGVLGGAHGSVKIYNNTIRTITFSTNYEYTSWEGPTTDFECPCTKEVKFFVSDVVGLDEVLRFE